MPPPSRSAPPPPPQEELEGASLSERLIAAAKDDNEDWTLEILEQIEDVNFADGLGNTALHYAVLKGSTDVIEHILNHDSCDVNPKNRLAGDTPLHIAVRQKWDEGDGVRIYLVSILLEAGADTMIKNRHGQRPIDLLPDTPEVGSDDEKVRAAIRYSEAEAMVADSGDVVDEDNDVIDPNDVASDDD